MQKKDIKRIKAVLLYILNKLPDRHRDVYYIVKTAFCAQKNHLVEYALPLFNDNIVALQFGPVPSLVYNILRVARGDCEPYRFCDKEVLSIADVISYQDESFSAKEMPDIECLSVSNIRCLDAAINEISNMGFGEIMKKTHSNEWDRAYHDGGNHIMDNIAIAKENGAPDEILTYLSEALDFDKISD